MLRALGQQAEDRGADIVPALAGVPPAVPGGLATCGGEVAAQTTQHVEESGEVLRFVGVLCHVGASLGENSAGVSGSNATRVPAAPSVSRRRATLDG